MRVPALTVPADAVSVSRMPTNESASLSEAADAALARRIASRQPGTAREEETELYRRFAPRVRLFGLKHLRNEADAQDLVQQVLLLTIQRLRAGEVRNPEAIGSFILGTSRTIAGAFRRTEARRGALIEQFGTVPIVGSETVDAVDAARVERCLKELQERDRLVLLLTFYAEMVSADIGRELGIAAGAVRVARHRALARLRECLCHRRLP